MENHLGAVVVLPMMDQSDVGLQGSFCKLGEKVRRNHVFVGVAITHWAIGLA